MCIGLNFGISHFDRILKESLGYANKRNIQKPIMKEFFFQKMKKGITVQVTLQLKTDIAYIKTERLS